MLLTCMRDAAAISLKLKHIDIARRRVFQDARQVNTKFKKTIETFFYPVGEDVEAKIGSTQDGSLLSAVHDQQAVWRPCRPDAWQGVSKRNEGWGVAIKSLILNPNKAADLGDALHETVKDKYNINTVNIVRNQLYQSLKNEI